MFSIKKGTFFEFATFMLQKQVFCFLLFFSSYGFASQTIVKVRELRNYREFQFADARIFIDKKKLDVIYTEKFGTVKIEKRLLGKSYTFRKRDEKKDHFLVASINEKRNFKKIGYLSSDLQTQFQSEICDPKAVFNQNVERILSPELIGKIKELEISNLFDKESCGSLTSERFEEFKKVLIGTLVYKQSSLQKCLDSKAAREIFLKDSALLNNANEVFSKYLDLIENIKTSKMKLKCGMSKESENKIASFSQNPLEIAINVINEKFNLKIDNIKAAMNHELLHMGMQQFKTSKGSRCMDEGFVNLFENVCKYASDTTLAKPPASNYIVESCLKGKEPDIETLSLSKVSAQVKPGDIQVIANVISSVPLENREESKRTTEVLVAVANSGNKPVFESVPDSVVQLAANAPVMTTSGQPLSSYEGDGEFHAVVADSKFSSSVMQLGESLSSSMGNASQLLTTALGNKGLVAAAAVAGTTAVAATRSGSLPNQYVPMTASEIFMDRYYPDSKEVQGVMNDPKLDSMSYDQKEAFYASGGKTKTKTETAVSMKLASSNPSAFKAEAANGTPSFKATKEIQAASTNSTNGSRAIASLPASKAVENTAGNTAAKVEEESIRESGVTRGTSVASAAQTASSVNPKTRFDSAIVQRLTAFSKVNEPAYTRVTERFNDQEFRQQLSARKIRIVGENGKPLWVSSIQPQRCFKDNKTTKVLEVVTCK